MYGVLIPGDEVTSWNMPVLNEFYVNYGIKRDNFRDDVFWYFFKYFNKIF